MTLSETPTSTTAPVPAAEPQTTEPQTTDGAAPPAQPASPLGRVLRHVRHGGTVSTDANAEQQAAHDESISPMADVVPGVAAADVTAVPDTAFVYMFDGLADGFPNHHLPNADPAATVEALRKLGAAMVEASPPQPSGDSTIPAVYTYWGQFIDHDLTLNTNQPSVLGDVTDEPLTPVPPAQVSQQLRNLRHPALNLDSVYGDGPTFNPAKPTQAADQYDGIKLKVGTVATDDGIPGERIPPVNDLQRDLPRKDKVALIGDGRNDENLIIAQFHVAFLKFHNAALKWVTTKDPNYNTPRKRFRRARRLTRWHYQWLVVHDYLKTVTLPGSTDQVLLGGNSLFDPRTFDEPSMPIEYSVAAYRFGHSQVRGGYDFNRNFGKPGVVIPFASLDLLFTFTGNSPQPFGGQTDVLPFNWVIEWDRFVHKGDSDPGHMARKIDTQLVPPLLKLQKEGNSPDISERMKLILKSLSVRNLLRGYQLSVPTGQAVAQAMGVPALTADQLKQNNADEVNTALADGGFLDKTPLWYYILKEAEVQANGNSLGTVGSRIVNETIIGQLRADRTSYLNEYGGWDPSHGLRLTGDRLITTIDDFFEFAGV